MKKYFQFLTGVFVIFCAFYGFYTMVRRFIGVKKYTETDEFDELYDEFVSNYR